MFILHAQSLQQTVLAKAGKTGEITTQGDWLHLKLHEEGGTTDIEIKRKQNSQGHLGVVIVLVFNCCITNHKFCPLKHLFIISHFVGHVSRMA